MCACHANCNVFSHMYVLLWSGVRVHVSVCENRILYMCLPLPCCAFINVFDGRITLSVYVVCVRTIFKLSRSLLRE